MNRTLGILIPVELLDDQIICDFVKPYLDSGAFSELKVERYQPPKKVKKANITFKMLEDNLEETCARNEINKDYALHAAYFWRMFYDERPTKILEYARVS